MFEDNHAGRGGAIFVKDCDDIIMENNLIQANQAINFGGGLYVEESAISNFRNNDFFANVAYYSDGGAIYSETSTMTLTLSKFRENSADDQGGGIYISGTYQGGDYFSLINCQITGNMTNSDGGGIYSDCFFYSASNTISDNNARFGSGGGIFHDGCTSQIVNTIIYNNTAAQNSNAFPVPDGNNGYSYTCTPTFTNCATCTSGDPDFIGSGDYNLSYGTSCNNTGDNNATHTNYDLDGKDRILNYYIDIGAYEDRKSHVACGQLTTATWTDHNTNGVDYVVNCDIEIPNGQTITISSGTEVAFNGRYKLDVKGVLDADGVTFEATQGNTWSGIRFLDLNNTNPGTSEIANSEITGVYKPHTGTCTNYDPDYSGAIFIGNSDDVEISNNEIHDNTVCDCGGGIYIEDSDPIINNNEIYSNSAWRAGGGIAIHSGEPSIYLNVIKDNQCITKGGGIYNRSTDEITMYNNLIANNSATQNGGGVFFDEDSWTNIYNFTVAANEAIVGYGGGFYHEDNSTATLKNNIIWDNIANYSSSDHVFIDQGSTTSYSYTCSDNSIAGCTICTTSNPEFVGSGDYSIGVYTSPCFDAGDDNVTHSSLDLNNDDRILNSAIDIGAYEIQIISMCGTKVGNWTDINKNGIDYVIDCDIEIPLGYTLNIGSGTTIAFDGMYKFDVKGALNASGSSSYPINFYAIDPQTGWLGINFGLNGSTYGGTSQLSYCNISDINKTQKSPTAGTEDDEEYSGAIFINANSSANILIDHCEIL
jgi:parallel beta-helix repeat protein